MSKIEWTGDTWNPISGCSRKSAGCQNCYAEVMTKRLAAMGQEKYQGLLNEQNRFNGKLKFDRKALLKPLSNKKPTTYFVNSMSDLFHENISNKWIDEVFAVMAATPQHTYQILTKRPERMHDYVNYLAMDNYYNFHTRISSLVGRHFIDRADTPRDALPQIEDYERNFNFPLPNVWLGTSLENNKEKPRVDWLKRTPAAIRFLSIEPLLEDLGDIKPLLSCESCINRAVHWCVDPVVDWVIVGGESGTGARGCDIDWIRSLVQQCESAGVPCFVKQLGKKSFYGIGDGTSKHPYRREYLKLENKKGGDIAEFPVDLQIRQMPV